MIRLDGCGCTDGIGEGLRKYNIRIDEDTDLMVLLGWESSILVDTVLVSLLALPCQQHCQRAAFRQSLGQCEGQSQHQILVGCRYSLHLSPKARFAAWAGDLMLATHQ